MGVILSIAKIAVVILLAVTAASALTLTTVESQARAAAAADSEFKDPATLQFRKFRQGSDGAERYICGEVNGKNSYGAYAGFEPFVVWPDRGEAGEFRMLTDRPSLIHFTWREEAAARCQLSASVAWWSLTRK